MHFFKFSKMPCWCCVIFYNQRNYLFISGYKSMMHSIKKVSPGQTFAGKLFLLLIRSRLIESSSDYTMYWYDASSIKGSHFFRFSKMQCWCYVIFYNQWNFTWSFHLKSTFSEKLESAGIFVWRWTKVNPGALAGLHEPVNNPAKSCEVPPAGFRAGDRPRYQNSAAWRTGENQSVTGFDGWICFGKRIISDNGDSQK